MPAGLAIVCPWREGAECALVRRLAPAATPADAAIAAGQCEDCQRAGEANVRHVGPAVASRLFAIALREKDQRLLSLAKPQLRQEKPRTDCLYLGRFVRRGLRDGAQTGCPNCEVHECDRHQLVALGSNFEGLHHCRLCRDYDPGDGPPAAKSAASEPPARLEERPEDRLPRPAKASGDVRRWMVGVTTAPRPNPTLPACLDSLIAAGWSTPHVFAEPGTALAARHEGLPVTRRGQTCGAFSNWWLALVELYHRDPAADAYLLCQDDAVFAAGNWRRYLEAALWPTDQTGVVSLYCSAAYDRGDRTGWFCFGDEFPNGRWVWGAVAFVFRRTALEAFFQEKRCHLHRSKDRSGGQKRFDVLVGNFARLQGYQIWYPSPSIVQHVGDTSTIYTSNGLGGRRQAKQWLGSPVNVDSKLTAAEITVTVCVAHCNRTDHLIKFLLSIAKAAANQRVEVVVADFASDDLPSVNALQSAAGGAKVQVVSLSRPFNRSRGLNAAAAKAKGAILAYLDADMLVPANFFEGCRWCTPGSAWFPVCWSLNQDGSGWWRTTGFGNAVVWRRESPTWNETLGRSWGGEDNDFHRQCQEAGLRIIREPLEGFLHQWHSPAARHEHHERATA